MEKKREVKDLKAYEGEDKIITSFEMQTLIKNQPQSIINLKSKSIPTLNALIDGFKDGELYAISGPTKNGKTLLCQTLTVDFCKQQEFPCWFSFEVPPRQFLSQFTDLPYFYVPSTLKSKAFHWLTERMHEAFQKYNCRVFFIDHLHYIFDMAQKQNISLQIGTVIRSLKSLCVENSWLIFLLCHTSKGARAEENMNYESIRDSSFVAQESDCVILVRRTPEKGENTAKISVEFHRRTGVMEKMIEIEKKNEVLVEIIRDEKDRWNL